MNKQEFERLYEAAFEAAARSGSPQPSTDYRPSWEKLQTKLGRYDSSRRRRARVGKFAILASALLLGAFLFGNTSNVRAIPPVFSTLYESSAGVLSYFFGRAEDQNPSQAKTPPPPDAMQSGSAGQPVSRMIVTDAAQADGLLSFPSPTFRYIPDGYRLNNVQVSYYGDKTRADSAVYLYLNQDGNQIAFSFVKLEDRTSLTASEGRKGVKVEQVELGDGPGVLYAADNGSTRLETVVGSLHVSLSGILPPDQIVRIYDGIAYE
ncbi:DUF4367 domain-containing protein [Cohnella panacarvi]|uniref:DUF4367 domain-containing protein n=1 Tax=Cohnella panacarvi TaxID=400776 RepID=UPI00047E6485|nr:DUF4367 domain-containing protein [Cohnella panacarvi]